ncbi:MAG: arylamine N-acetyltransferase [Coriobacteriales bacterium]|jgi:N-hydroxyarylamine O-acetyltransferase|nr:arylamine N-acetyltransferase [Coriobacteriales bacterium]
MVIPAEMPEFFIPIYGKYYEPLPDTEAYLARIGLAGQTIDLNRAGLDKLIWANLCHVPFENIDLFDYDKPVDFGIADLFQKIVVQHRGGYCFELNSLFMALLEAVGFEVYPIGVRILMAGEGFIPAIAHRASIVLLDGKRYFADVGFGNTSAAGGSICVDDDQPQEVHGQVYSVEDRPYHHKIILRHKAEGPSPEFLFLPDPFPIVDFVAYNNQMSTTGFRAKRIANLRTEEGSLSIDGDILRRTIGSERIETPLADAAAAWQALTEQYGMQLTEPLKELAADPDARFPR